MSEFRSLCGRRISRRLADGVRKIAFDITKWKDVEEEMFAEVLKETTEKLMGALFEEELKLLVSVKKIVGYHFRQCVDVNNVVNDILILRNRLEICTDQLKSVRVLGSDLIVFFEEQACMLATMEYVDTFDLKSERVVEILREKKYYGIRKYPHTTPGLLTGGKRKRIRQRKKKEIIKKLLQYTGKQSKEVKRILTSKNTGIPRVRFPSSRSPHDELQKRTKIGVWNGQPMEETKIKSRPSPPPPRQQQQQQSPPPEDLARLRKRIKGRIFERHRRLRKKIPPPLPPSRQPQEQQKEMQEEQEQQEQQEQEQEQQLHFGHIQQLQRNQLLEEREILRRMLREEKQRVKELESKTMRDAVLLMLCEDVKKIEEALLRKRKRIDHEEGSRISKKRKLDHVFIPEVHVPPPPSHHQHQRRRNDHINRRIPIRRNVRLPVRPPPPPPPPIRNFSNDNQRGRHYPRHHKRSVNRRGRRMNRFDHPQDRPNLFFPNPPPRRRNDMKRRNGRNF